MKRFGASAIWMAGVTAKGWWTPSDRERGSGIRSERDVSPSKALYAIPTRDLVSLPLWIHSEDSSLISQVVTMELEKRGLESGEGLASWKSVATTRDRSLIQLVAIPWEFERAADRRPEWTAFLPQFSLFPAPESAAVFWREENRWTVGFTRGRRWLHAENLGGEDTPDRIAREAALVNLSLAIRDVVDRPALAIVWDEWDPDLHRALSKAFGIEVLFEERPRPAPELTESWALAPVAFRKGRRSVASRRRGWGVAALLAIFLVLVAAVVLFRLERLRQGNERLVRQIESHRADASRIESTVERWQALGPAIDPRRSSIDILHRLAELVPAEGVRIESFELRDESRVLFRAEASSVSRALQLKGAIENSGNLAEFRWEIPPPRETGGTVELSGEGFHRFATQ